MRKTICLAFAAAFIFTCSNTFAQVSVVMKAMNGTTKLNGGSIVPGHTGEIDLLSYSQGESRCSTCNVPSLSSLNAMLVLSPATISFKKLLLNGTKLTSVDIFYIRAGSTFYKIHMENVTVESVQESGSGENPTFAISLIPDRMAWLNVTESNNRTSYGWDLTNNTEWQYVF